MSRNLTPLPARTGRAGTFDGMEKLFFERAAAIEAGEKTAPPEVIGVPHARWRRWLNQLAALELYQKLGIGAGLVFMVVAAVLTLRGGTPPKAAEPLEQAVAARPAAPAAAETKSPTAVAAKKPTVARVSATSHRTASRHARTKHTRKTSTRR